MLYDVKLRQNCVAIPVDVLSDVYENHPELRDNLYIECDDGVFKFSRRIFGCAINRHSFAY